MSTGIQWTDETWNPTVGCDRVSPGCAKCYAKTLHDRRHKAFLAGKKVAPQYAQPFEVLQMLDNRLDAPLRWRKPRRIFVNSVSDLFHEDVPDAFIDRVFAVMALAPQHTFQILTKRAERQRAYVSHAGETGLVGVSYAWANHRPMPNQQLTWPLPNVWLGVSVENQRFADERIPLLLQTPAAVRFLSAEPLLESVDLAKWIPYRCGCRSVGECFHNYGPHLDWIIVGGESGRGSRPFDIAWARSIVQECKAAGVACFVKQLGSDPRDAAAERDDMCARETWPAGWMPTIDGRRVWRPDLTSRKGGDPLEWPADLRVREFPEVRA